VPVDVIADSSFLLAQAEAGLDVDRELTRVFGRKVRLVIPQPVLDEVQRIAAQGSPKARRKARFVLERLTGYGTVNSSLALSGPVDEMILRLSKEKGVPVATNDRSLRRKLRDINIPVVYVREKSHLSLEGGFF
jgi:rRNA-processing protein FCF1